MEFEQLSTLQKRKRKLEVRSSQVQRKTKRKEAVDMCSEEVQIIEKGEWLNDAHISYVNLLLKRQFPSVCGLYDPKFGQDLSFPVSEDPFIQILNVCGNHWMTVAGVSPTQACVYDSLQRYVSVDAMAQIAAIMNSKEKKIELKAQNTQFQKGGSDCGLFAIAFATALCFGTDPASCRYEQDKMRPHFVECVKKQRMTPFPSTGIRPGRPVKEAIEVFCSCRLPETTEEKMVQCMACFEWYHQSCESVPDDVFDDSKTEWKCVKCT